jgi:hypothetical protein
MPEQRYAEGDREPSTCYWCKSPVWVVYHGRNANHTLEPRANEALRAIATYAREPHPEPCGTEPCVLCLIEATAREALNDPPLTARG